MSPHCTWVDCHLKGAHTHETRQTWTRPRRDGLVSFDIRRDDGCVLVSVAALTGLLADAGWRRDT